MNKIESTLLAFFSNTPDKPIVVAYSGGVDSQVLLVALAMLKQQGLVTNPLSICHVNHGLSPHAQTWQAFAKEQCEHFALPLISEKLNLKKQNQQSLEALARDARYQVLVNASSEPAIIVTGHHLNDQAETFLLALKRGAGLKGLSAMAETMALEQHILARPLLAISRNEIVSYAKQKNLSWVEDESNADQHFDRNFIRHTVLPAIEKRWPSINKTIARSAEHCIEAQQLIDELAQQDLVKCQLATGRLSIEKLNTLSEARLKNLLRYFLSIHNQLMPSREQLGQICQQINAEPDKSPVIQLANCCIRRFKDELHLTSIYQDVSLWQQKIVLNTLAEQGQFKLPMPDKLGMLSFFSDPEIIDSTCDWQAWIKKPTDEQVVSVKFAHDNPKCFPQYRQKSRSLKKVLQELGIAPWQRKRLPLLFYDNELVAVIGYFVCKPYLVEHQEMAFLLSYKRTDYRNRLYNE